MPGEKRGNSGADHRARGSDSRAQSATRDARSKLALMTAAHGCADRESTSKSDNGADGGAFAACPSTPAVAIYLEHVLSSRGYGPGRDLLRRPVLECTIHRTSFQRQPNVIAQVQLRKGLPVVPILRLSRRPQHADEHEREK